MRLRPYPAALLPQPQDHQPERHRAARPGAAVLIHTGGCHCGRVRIEVEAPARVTCQDCNCSICRKSGYLHLIVPRSQFRLLQGEDDLVSYRFNTGVAEHRFCRVCGIKAFYTPRSNPDGIDVNVRCLDPPPREVVVEPFDGRNWEQHADALAPLSREPDQR